jgi:hypothetical protein
MKKFILEIVDYCTPYLAKNGDPIILAQIEKLVSAASLGLKCGTHIFHIN